MREKPTRKTLDKQILPNCKTFITCQVCGRQKETYKYRPANTCSSKCYGKLRSIRARTQIVTCLVCGKELIAKQSKIKDGAKKYCSRNCVAIAQKSRRIVYKCKNCGKEFTRVPAVKGKCCSVLCRNVWLMKTGQSGSNHRAKGGKREDIGIYVRSSWEANYARYLNWLLSVKQIKNWEYEKDTFYFEKIKRGCRAYMPDFKVTENNGDIIYHEVKGYMDQKSKTALKRMAKYHPNIKIIVIEKTAYRRLKEQCAGGIIKNWE